MKKALFPFQVLTLTIVLVLAGCLPAGTPPDNQTALETIVASTLTAMAADSPIPAETSVPEDAPAPVEASQPEAPPFTPPPALQVV